MSHRSADEFREEARMKSLQSYAIMDTPEEEGFENLVALAANICNVPYAQINFLDEHRTWSKAKYGIPMRELPRNSSFCDQTIREPENLIVTDASTDKRFKDFPFVSDEPHIRFYAGFNIKDEGDLNLGTICVLDTCSRELTASQKQALGTLAKEIEARIQLHKRNQELRTLSSFLESATDLLLIVDPLTETVIRSSDKATGFFNTEWTLASKKMGDLIPDQDFLELIREWRSNGEQGSIHPIATIKDIGGNIIYLEISIRREQQKWYMSAKNVTEQVEYQKRLEKLLDEKNILLSEVHHRVKNNLAVISGILQLEEFKTESAEVKQALHSNYMRVRSMSLIHEEMYRRKSYRSIQFDQYLEHFVEGIEADNRALDQNIKIHSDFDSVALNLNQAIPCALITNELVSNALKFAFEGMDKGSIEISFKHQSGGEVCLCVKDSGIGLPDDFDLRNSPTLGTTLISSYSDQMNSKLMIRSEDGAEFRITFKPDLKSVGSGAAHLQV